jgi:zinc protease
MKTIERLAIPYLEQTGHFITFENGHSFVFVPKPGEVFNISTWVRTGSIHEDSQNNGVSHFLEHLMFKGTERFAPGEFDKAMESMGAIINAATWKDFTFYYVTGPKGQAPGDGLSENFELALDRHADMLLHSTLPESEIGLPYDPYDTRYAGEKRERSVVIEEISMREDQPWTKIYNAVNAMMYPEGHPYRRDVIGSRSIIGHISRQSIMDYYKTWYVPSALTTIVVGDFDFEMLKERVAKAFDFSGHSQGRPNYLDKTLDIVSGVHSETKRYEKIVGDVQTAFFLQGYHGATPANLQETIALDVISHILGEGRSSRLIQTLLEKPETPVFNYIGCDQSIFKLGNVFFIQGNFNLNPNEGESASQKALNDLQQELDKLLTTDPVTSQEFERAVKKLRVGFAETSETAAGIAEAIGEALTVVGDLSGYLDYLHALDTLTLETVNAVANRYLKAEQSFTSVMLSS